MTINRKVHFCIYHKKFTQANIEYLKSLFGNFSRPELLSINFPEDALDSRRIYGNIIIAGNESLAETFIASLLLLSYYDNFIIKISDNGFYLKWSPILLIDGLSRPIGLPKDLHLNVILKNYGDVKFYPLLLLTRQVNHSHFVDYEQVYITEGLSGQYYGLGNDEQTEYIYLSNEKKFRQIYRNLRYDSETNI